MQNVLAETLQTSLFSRSLCRCVLNNILDADIVRHLNSFFTNLSDREFITGNNADDYISVQSVENAIKVNL